MQAAEFLQLCAQALSEVLRAKLEQVEALERTVQQKTAEAARTSKEITRLRTEAVRLLAEENEKRSLARCVFPLS